MGGFVPLGYDADGRTLRIKHDEAQTVRRLYALYQEHGTIRAVREEAGRLDLRTKVRTGADGQISGGLAFRHGHIHAILTNPLYAGRIRHRKQVHEGQHPAIVEPAIWEAVQAQLQAAATVRRGRMRAGAGSSVSALTGRVFDETGDRLTPTHAKTRKGVRLRYYVSHRLIRPGEAADRSGWRLPGPELEAAVAGAVAARLDDPATAAALLADPGVDMIEATARRLGGLTSEARESGDSTRILALVERVDLAPGEMAIRLGSAAMAALLDCRTDAIAPAALAFAVPFRTRKRGVETRLMLGAGTGARPVDRTLLANIARAEAWFRRLKTGESHDAIARAEGVSKDRVMKLIPFAFLSPRLVARVVAGTQPVGLTTEYLIRHDIPADWAEQERRFAALG